MYTHELKKKLQSISGLSSRKHTIMGGIFQILLGSCEICIGFDN